VSLRLGLCRSPCPGEDRCHRHRRHRHHRRHPSCPLRRRRRRRQAGAVGGMARFNSNTNSGCDVGGRGRRSRRRRHMVFTAQASTLALAQQPATCSSSGAVKRAAACVSLRLGLCRSPCPGEDRCHRRHHHHGYCRHHRGPSCPLCRGDRHPSCPLLLRRRHRLQSGAVGGMAGCGSNTNSGCDVGGRGRRTKPRQHMLFDGWPKQALQRWFITVHTCCNQGKRAASDFSLVVITHPGWCRRQNIRLGRDRRGLEQALGWRGHGGDRPCNGRRGGRPGCHGRRPRCHGRRPLCHGRRPLCHRGGRHCGPSRHPSGDRLRWRRAPDRLRLGAQQHGQASKQRHQHHERPAAEASMPREHRHAGGIPCSSSSEGGWLTGGYLNAGAVHGSDTQ
jgi:hypothetical protein